MKASFATSATSLEPATVRVGDTVVVTTTLKGRVVLTVRDTAVVRQLSAGSVVAIGAGRSYVVARGDTKKTRRQADSALVIVSGVTPPPDTTPTPPSLAPVASVTVTPGTVSVPVGDTARATVTLRDSTNNVLTGRTVTWTSGTPSVASVTTTGLIKGLAAGKSNVIATSEGKADTTVVTVTTSTTPTPPAVRVGYYVAPNGRSAGSGSMADPWDILTALAGAGGRIKPGDTVWVRGGTYRGGEFRSTLVGTASTPVVVRAYPGERATIDGNMVINGSYTAFWGLEVMNSNPVANGKQGIDVRAPGTKLIALVVHDTGKSAIGFWMEAPDAEITGCIIYNAGTHENLDHGIYAMNRSGVKRITNNVVFNSLAYGLHLYGQTPQELKNFIVDGNTIFNSAAISNNYVSKPNALIGGAGVVASGIVFTNNTLYFSGSTGSSNLRLGYDATVSLDITARGNYVIGGSPALEMRQWSQATFSGNTYYGTSKMASVSVGSGWSPSAYRWSQDLFLRDPSAAAWSYNGTSYTFSEWQQAAGLGATDQAVAQTPTGVRVTVRPDVYEAGRALVTVNNWALQAAVSVDLTGVLRVGDAYEVRSVQNVFGAPIVSGVYGGGLVSVPMQRVTPPIPIGRSTRSAPVTGPSFDVFLVTRKTG